MIKNIFLLTSTSFALFLSAPLAHAVTLSMEEGPNGDRIRISQIENNQNIQSLRISPDTLFVQVDNATQVPITMPEAIDGDLVSGFLPSNDGVSISLGDTAFGFIQSEDSNGDILIDVYPDTMGARWKQSENAKNVFDRLEAQQALPIQNYPNVPLQAQSIPIVTPEPNTPQNALENPLQNTANNPITANNVATSNAQNTANMETSQNLSESQPMPTDDNTVGNSTVNTHPQNINVNLDNQGAIQAPQANNQLQNQAQAPLQNQAAQTPQINITASQNSQNPPVQNQGITQTQNIPMQNGQAQSPDININLQTSNTQEIPQQSTQKQSTQTSLSGQDVSGQVAQSPDININVENNSQVSPDAQLLPAEEVAPNTQEQAINNASSRATPDININMSQNENIAPVTENIPETQETLGTSAPSPAPSTTSFSFALTDQTESEAVVIQPREIHAGQTRQNEQQIAQNTQGAQDIQSMQGTAPAQSSNQQANQQPNQQIETQDLSTQEIDISGVSENIPSTDTHLTLEDRVQDTASQRLPMGDPMENSELADLDTPQSPQTNVPNPAPAPLLDKSGEPVQAEIIYLDEEGNVVPAPLNIPQTLAEMDRAAEKLNYEDLLEATNLLRDKPLPPELLEDVLYNRAIAMYHLDQDDLQEKGADVIRAVTECINLNPDSSKVPVLLSLMVPSAIAIDHIGEAKFAVDKLLDQFPQSEDTPPAVLLLANKYLDDQHPIDASKYLDILINDYPSSSVIQEAAILQTKSIYSQGDLNRTLTFLDFIDRRFDKVYLTAPEYFTIRGRIEEDAKRYDKVVSNYLTLYNLDPKGELADFALDKVASAYYQQGQKDSARKILEELVLAFPDSPYRASALQKIGENGVYEGNISLEEMLALFNEPNPNLPNIYYNQIIREYPQSEEAKNARLRLAAQSLWEKEYINAADQALDVFNEYVGKEEGDRALEILIRSVAPVLSLAISEKNYEHVLSLWEKYPPIHTAYTPYAAPLRMSLGRALLNRQQEKEGEEMLAPFMDKIPVTQEEFEDGLYAYSITLANAFKRQDWPKVLEVTEKVEDWDLPKDTGLQRLYSTALASQNLGLAARALPIWQALAPNPEVPLYQRAYAQYFLARNAENRQNLREAYQANLDALAMFDDLYTQQSPYANLERNRESIAALMDITEMAGRYTESMQWLNRYRIFVPADSPDYAGVQLREARLYKKMGDDLRWRSILEQVRDKEPDSVFGKMAASELTSFEMARDLNRMTTRR